MNGYEMDSVLAGISVVMATYNGERFVREQLSSICSQLSCADEIVVSDDGSEDKTVDIVKELSERYKQIKLIDGPHQGVAANFLNAIDSCTKELIFLSDQDDIWLPNKVSRVNEVFDKNPEAQLVLHNAVLFGSDVGSEKLITHYAKGVVSNILFSSYWGCCMAFRRTLIEGYSLNRGDIVAHDQIIGLLSERRRSTVFLDEPLIYHRIHNRNMTARLSMLRKIQFRIAIMRNYLNVIATN